jgi:predicted nuclease of predicted toxin-antitoxin system
LPHLFIDENIPRAVKEWLIERGYDLTSVAQVHLKGSKDQTIGDYAVNNGLTVLTLDNHFVGVYRSFKKNGITVIIIKAKPATPSNIIEILDSAQRKLNLKEITGKLVIISKRKVRIIS